MIGFVLTAALLGLLTMAWLAWPRRVPEPAPGASATEARASRGLLVAMAAGLTVITAGGYALWGTPVALQPGAILGDPLAAAANLPPEQREKLLRSLVRDRQREVDANPQDAAAWSALARTQFEAAQVPEAVESFRRAATLKPTDADTLVDLADVLAVQADRRMGPESVRLIEQALGVNPNHTKALALAGIAAFQRGDPASAVGAWQRAIDTAPADHPIAMELKAMLDQAREMARGGAPGGSGGPGGSSATPPVAQAGPGPSAGAAPRPGPGPAPSATQAAPGAGAISGRITLAPALAARVQPDDTVFVFARAAEGSRMPLAIQRHRVRDLPLEFTLDDRHAMSPAATLSSATSVVVEARVSRSGNAMPQPGDLQGLSARIAPGTRGLAIVIGEEVPAR